MSTWWEECVGWEGGDRLERWSKDEKDEEDE